MICEVGPNGRVRDLTNKEKEGPEMKQNKLDKFERNSFGGSSNDKQEQRA